MDLHSCAQRKRCSRFSAPSEFGFGDCASRFWPPGSVRGDLSMRLCFTSDLGASMRLESIGIDYITQKVKCCEDCAPISNGAEKVLFFVIFIHVIADR